MSEERLHVKLVLDGKAYETGLDRAETATKSFGDTVQGVAEQLTLFATTTLVYLGSQGLKTAMDLEESMNKVEVAFGSASKSILSFSETTTDTLGISQGAALDMAGTFGDMATGMGISQTRAAEMSKRLVELAGDLASFKNIKIDVAQTALNSVFTGETESLKMLGVVMTEANLQAFALANGIAKKVEKMTEAEKVTLRYAFVIDKTKNAHGDYARTADGATNSTRTMQERFKEVTGEIMAQMLPAYTRIVNVINDVLKATSSLSPEMKRLLGVLGGIVAIAGPVTLAIIGIAGAFNTLSAAILRTPLLSTAAIVVTALTTIIIAVVAYWDELQVIFVKAQIGFTKFMLALVLPLEKLGLMSNKAGSHIQKMKDDIKELNGELYQFDLKKLNGIYDVSKVMQIPGIPQVKQTPQFPFRVGVTPPKTDTPINPLAGISDTTTKKFTPPSDAGTMQFGKKFTEGIKKLQQQAETAHAEFIIFWERLPDKKINGLSLNGIFQTQLFAGGKIELGITEETLKDFDISGEKIAKKFDGLIKKIQDGIGNMKTNTISPMKEAILDLASETEKAFNEAFSSLKLIGLDTFSSVIEGLITKAFGGEYDWKQMFAGLLRALSQGMAAIAQKLIILGIGLNAAMPGSGINQIAAGIALLAASGAAAAGAGLVSSKTIANSSTASNINQSGFIAPSFNVQGAFTLKGTDLVASINNTKNQFGL